MKRTIYLATALVLGTLSLAVAFPGGNVVDKADLPEFYARWFEDPYEYMFDRENTKIELAGNSFGEFQAGVQGILFYGGLEKCAQKYNEDTEATNWGSYWEGENLQKMAGFDISQNEWGEFSRWNLKNGLVVWGYENLIPDPDQEILGTTFQKIYSAMFSRWFRMLTATYYSLHNDYEIRDIAFKYQEATQIKGIDGIEWLTNKFEGRFPDLDREHNYTNQTVSMTYGFWLRRYHDGTIGAFWEGLNRIMKQYDKKWFKKALKGKI